MFYLIWIFCTILFYSLYAWVSVQNNLYGEKWGILLWFLPFIFPIWPIISKFSKNIVFDGLLFDSLLTLSYTATILYLTNGFIKLQYIQIFGIFLIILGIFLMKVKWY